MKPIPDHTPVAELTLGQLRAELRSAIENHVPSYGMDADVAASTIEADVRDLRDELEGLGRAHDTFVKWVFEVYDWFQAGMPGEASEELRKTRPVLRLDRYARAALELREDDGTWPTQEAVAEHLGGIDSRNIRDGRIGAWPGILARAAELAARPEPEA